MNTPNSTIAEPYKHLRIAKAIMIQQIAPWRNVVFGCGRFRTFPPGFGFGQRYHLDRHGQLALKRLRLSVLNEMHTNSYTGPRLISKMFKISKSDRYNQRSNNKMLMLSKPKTNSMKRTFGYTSAKDWKHKKIASILIDLRRYAYRVYNFVYDVVSCVFFCIIM